MMMQKLYSKTKIAGLAVVALSFFTALTASAQIKLGNNGTNIQPSALLELESTNRGLLIPRMPNTVAIDLLGAPEGMVVYITTEPNSGLHIKKASGWERLQGYLNGVASFTSLTVTGAVTAGSFSGPLTGNATTATTAATATNAINSQVTNDVATTAITYPVFVGATPGFQPLRTGSGNLSYVPSTGILTARGFNGPLVGNVTGNATTAADAENAVNIRITDDVNSATPMYPTFVNGTTGPIPARVSSTKLSFIPSSGELTATRFRGALDGNATSATNVTGVVNAVNGGTGFAVYTPGDILYSDASNTLAKLAIGTPGTILRVDPNRRPVWSTAGAGTVINVSGTSNRIVVTDPTVSPQIDIDANYVGQNSITTLGTIATGTWNGSTISTLHGGTGVTNLTANEILIGRGPGVSIGSISLVNTLGKVLTSNGPNALPTFESPGVGDMVLNAVQTITGGKTFNDGTLNINGSISGTTIVRASANNGGTITLPSGNRTLASLDGAEILSNKEIAAPNITGAAQFNSFTGSSLILGPGAALTTTAQTGNPGSIVMSDGPTITSPTFTGTVNAGPIISSGTIRANRFQGTADYTANVGALTAAAVEIGINDVSNASTTANNTIVKRNASGDFTAGVITATGGVVGNSSTATRLFTQRSIYGTQFDGTGDLIGPIAPEFGGSGVNNGTNTLTLEGIVSHRGSPYTQTFRATTNADVTLPQSGTLYSDRPNSIPAASLLASLITKTGTGLPVFATSPTLTTPNLGTPSALVGTNITGTAAGLTAGNVTTNANLTGAIVSTGNATTLGAFTSADLLGALSNETGGGAAVFANTPTLVTPILGVATATSINGNTITNGSGTLTLAAGSTFATNNGSITLTGPSDVTLPATGTLIAGITSPATNLNFASVPDGGSEVVTIAVAGAALSDPVSIGLPNAVMGVAGLSFQAWVSAAGTVSIRFTNNSGGNVEPDGSYRVTVFK